MLITLHINLLQLWSLSTYNDDPRVKEASKLAISIRQLVAMTNISNSSRMQACYFHSCIQKVNVCYKCKCTVFLRHVIGLLNKITQQISDKVISDRAKKKKRNPHQWRREKDI